MPGIVKGSRDRLHEYIAAENIQDNERVFPLGYTRAW